MNLVTPAAWCAALFLAATLFSHTVALRLLLLFAGIALVIAAALRARLRGAEPGIVFAPPLLLPFALWAAWAALSTLWTLDPAITRKELQNEIGYAFLAYWLCFAGAQAAGSARVLLGIVGLGALAVCALALYAVWLALSGTLGSLYGGPGAFASTLLILFPSTLMLAWYAMRKNWHRALVGLAVALLAIYALAGYAVQSRILWVALAAQIVLFTLLLLRRPPASSVSGRRAKLLVVSLASLAVAGAIAMEIRVHGERVAAAPGEASRDVRIALWQSVLGRIAERPLMGSGFGRGMARHELREELANRFVWHSHNQFLDTALQLGWTGLALLVLLLGWTIWLGWKVARSADDLAFACGAALVAVVVGMTIRNMTDVLWVRQSALLYWGVVGVLLAWGTRAAAGASGPAR
ncbi:MAG: O-antigen ligase family protein [Betaproteobacteria bacterium]|nr:O-antigen ligase family protein [Betaproteobacteria bacterium]